jgi:ethanolamine utilization protein EutN
MQLAKVIGTLVATQKAKGLQGIKLLLTQRVTDESEPIGKPLIAIDATCQAGDGDLVLIESGREAALALPDWFNPADQAIIGIVDQVHTIHH